MQAQINGITLAYSDRGTGLPLVFVHGFPLNRTMWAPQEAALSSRFRVITVDLRGHGESDAPLWHYTIDQFAGDVKALLDYLSIQQAVLAGLSMGGYVLFAFYRKYADRVKGLILADTRAEADRPEQAAWRFQLAQRAYKNGTSVVADELVPKLLCAATTQHKPTLVQQVRAIIGSSPISGVIGDLMAMAERPDSTSLLSTITCPTLLLVGDGDILTTPADHERMAKEIPGARLLIIPEAGHLSNLEQADAFTRAIESFVAEV